MMFTPDASFRRSSWARRLAALLTLALVCPPLSGLLPAAQAQTVPVPASMTPGGVRSILLFPSAASAAATTAAGDATTTLTASLDEAIKLRLNSSASIPRSSSPSFCPRCSARSTMRPTPPPA